MKNPAHRADYWLVISNSSSSCTFRASWKWLLLIFHASDHDRVRNRSIWKQWYTRKRDVKIKWYDKRIENTYLNMQMAADAIITNMKSWSTLNAHALCFYIPYQLRDNIFSISLQADLDDNLAFFDFVHWHCGSFNFQMWGLMEILLCFLS